MTTVAAERSVAAPRTTAGRLTRFIGRAPVHLFLMLVALVWLLPTVGLLITSFRPRGDIQATGWWETLSTMRFTLDNYVDVLVAQGMGSAFLNSLQIALPSTILPLVIASAAAYAFAWMRIPGGDWLFLLMVALMVVPVQMVLVPLLQLFNTMGVTQSFIGIWIAHTTYALPFGIFLLRNFFITLPRDLIEAARMDGASSFRIFTQIVMPLSVPAIASYGIFQFLWVWNDLLMAIIFVQNAGALPMTVQINNLLGTYGTEWHLLSAGAFLLMVVPLAVFLSLQRFFVQGLLAGSVK